MELSINKKAFDLLKERYGEQRFAEERFQSGFEVFIFEIKAISCGIFGEINEDDATKVFEAEIGWGVFCFDKNQKAVSLFFGRNLSSL